MVNGLSYHLLRKEGLFQGYCTLTFGANWNDRKTRNKVERVFAWLRDVYEFHTGSRELDGKIELIAEELGDKGGRFHYHILLGSLPKQLSKSDCFAMAWLWKEQYKGGFASIRPYDGSLAGVRYVLKSLDLVDLRAISSESAQVKAQALAGVHVRTSTSYQGANAYEVGKIGSGQGLEVTLSLGLLSVLQSGANSRRCTERSVGFFRRKKRREKPQQAHAQKAGS